MESQKQVVYTRVKVIHHHIHHHHYRRRKHQREKDQKSNEINYHIPAETKRRRHSHKHKHHDYEETEEIIIKSEESSSDPNKQEIDEHGHIMIPIPSQQRSHYLYYIPKPPEEVDLIIPKMKRRRKKEKKEKKEFPYPYEKFTYLNDNPLPEGDDKNDENNRIIKETKKLKTIDDYPKYAQKGQIPNYWNQVEPAIVGERLGGYNEIPQKQLPMMYPFTQKSPRKLPWDYSEVEIVPTRPNRPIKQKPPRSFSYYEEFIIEAMRKPRAFEKPTIITSKSPLFQIIQSWVQVCLGNFILISNLTSLGVYTLFNQFEQDYHRIVLVLYPLQKDEDPAKYIGSQFPPTMNVYRCISTLLKPMPRKFLLCAADLGTEFDDNHPECLPTKNYINNRIKNHYDSIFYRHEEIDTIMILSTERVIPLYSFTISFKK